MRARQDLADARRQVRWPWSRRCGELREDAAKVELMDLLAPATRAAMAVTSGYAGLAGTPLRELLQVWWRQLRPIAFASDGLRLEETKFLVAASMRLGVDVESLITAVQAGQDQVGPDPLEVLDILGGLDPAVVDPVEAVLAGDPRRARPPSGQEDPARQLREQTVAWAWEARVIRTLRWPGRSGVAYRGALVSLADPELTRAVTFEGMSAPAVVDAVTWLTDRWCGPQVEHGPGGRPFSSSDLGAGADAGQVREWLCQSWSFGLFRPFHVVRGEGGALRVSLPATALEARDWVAWCDTPGVGVHVGDLEDEPLSRGRAGAA